MSSHVVAFRALQEQPPSIVGGEMKEYQLRGLSFLLWLYDNGLNGIIGDEMGLGEPYCSAGHFLNWSV